LGLINFFKTQIIEYFEIWQINFFHSFFIERRHIFYISHSTHYTRGDKNDCLMRNRDICFKK
jgi:hypothetical protein